MRKQWTYIRYDFWCCA